MFSAKKGQVTIFIIIGIVIIMIIGGVMYMTSSATKLELTAEVERATQEGTQSFRPISAFTEDCLSQTAEEGLIIAGEQGGYIQSLDLDIDEFDPSDSEGVKLGSLGIPYWHYNRIPNSQKNIVFSTKKPPLHSQDGGEASIEAQIERFILKNIESCLQNYTGFDAQGFVFQRAGTKDATVWALDDGVRVTLKMPMKVQRGDAVQPFREFTVGVPVKLKHYYEVAELLVQAQENHSFLERQALEIIMMFSGQDRDKLPPTTGVSFGLFSALSWQEDRVGKQLGTLLTTYVPMLRMTGSSNFHYSDAPLAKSGVLTQKMLDNMVLTLNGAQDLGVHFDFFPSWNPYLKMNSQGGTIKPTSTFASLDVLNFGMQEYRANYDLSYPVMVTLKDDFALNGRGYNFVFALESNIRNNNPGIGGKEFVQSAAALPSISCDTSQALSAPLRLVVINSKTDLPEKDVKVDFEMPNQGTCQMGVTDANGVLETAYPLAYGGTIHVLKDTFIGSSFPIDTYKYKTNAQTIGTQIKKSNGAIVTGAYIHPKVAINVDVRKKDMQKCMTPLACQYTSYAPFSDSINCDKSTKRYCFVDGGTQFLGAPIYRFDVNGSFSLSHEYYFVNNAIEPTDVEESTITMKRVSDFDGSPGKTFTTAATLQGNSQGTLDLIPGLYEVRIMTVANTPIVIPKDTRCFHYSIVISDKEECFDMPETVLEKSMVANTNWNSPATYLKITPEMVYGSKKITFFGLGQDLTNVHPSIESNQKLCSGLKLELGWADSDFLSTCQDSPRPVPGIVSEDLQVQGQLGNLSSDPRLYSKLQPLFT